MPRNLKDFAGKDPIFIDANIFLHHAFDSDAMSVEFLVGVESRSFGIHFIPWCWKRFFSNSLSNLLQTF